MKIHVQSDQHLEFQNFPELYMECIADVTVCAGDLAPVDQCESEIYEFFTQLRDKTEHIIWVLGNHEYYHGTYLNVNDAAQEIADDMGVHLLGIPFDKPEVTIDGVTFWGDTFWTDCNNGDWFVKQKLKQGLNDFDIVYYQGLDANGNYKTRKFHPDNMIALNTEARENINWDADVIITHHAPIYIPPARYEFSDHSYGWYNAHLDEQIASWKGKWWLHGHTHESRIDSVNGTNIVTNCHGYMHMTEDIMRFDPKLILEI